MKLQAPLDTSEFVMNDGATKYVPDADGMIHVDDETHLRPLRALGCTIPGDPEAQTTVIEGEAADSALARENEQLKVQIGNFKDQVNQLQDLLTTAGQVEDDLRNRVQELEAAAVPAGDVTGSQTDAEGAGGSSDTDEAALVAPESAIKEVNGILVTDPEAFDSAEYNFLKEWLKVHEVHVPGGIRKTEAIAACKSRLAELQAGG